MRIRLSPTDLLPQARDNDRLILECNRISNHFFNSKLAVYIYIIVVSYKVWFKTVYYAVCVIDKTRDHVIFAF